MRILVLNTGSSSLKWALFDVEATSCVRGSAGIIEGIGSADDRVRSYKDAFDAVLDELAAGPGARIDAIGHRVVQGGLFVRPTIIDALVMEGVSAERELAPLHSRPSVEAMAAARARLGAMPMVAVFDTAFHATMPAVASRYALPSELQEKHGVGRYGFHGIAHRSLTERYAELAGMPLTDVLIITLQLGNGCSATAVREGMSIDTSMGFTPLEGLVMGTRSGDIDAAVVTYLQRAAGMTVDQVDELLNRGSGLLGVSGKTSDMRGLLQAESEGDERAHLAIEMFCYRVRKYIGAYLAVLGHAQAVVFGGGIGERSPEVRRRICEPLQPLGLHVDGARNAALAGGEGRFGRDGSPIAAWVIASDEERIIARDTFDVLSRSRAHR
jgi:acetate kinase